MSNNIVKIRTEHSNDLKTLFDILKEVLHEFKMEFIQPDPSDPLPGSGTACDGKNLEKGGIKIIEFDEHQTLLIYIKLEGSQFSEFHVKYKKHSIGLDLQQLHKFLKTLERECIVTLSIDQDDEQHIKFQTSSNTKSSSSIYKQKLMDLNEQNKNLPQQAEFQMSVNMESNDFHKMCREMNQFSDNVEIICTSNEITFKCVGDSCSLVKKFSNSDSGVQIKCCDENVSIVQAIYELKYLVTFGKCVNLCQDIQLYMRNDYPLFIKYHVASLGIMTIGLSPVSPPYCSQPADYDKINGFYSDSKKTKVKGK